MMDRVAAERAEALRETRGDLIAFVGAFGIGLALYIVLHAWLHVRQAFVTFAVLAVMFGYAYFAAKQSRFRVRLDQAGDNAYYLGLLFTLTSMAFALYEFGVTTDAGVGAGRAGETGIGQTGVDEIISNFGIALASTVAGIFLRVFLHQMRVDPADVENMTRIELSDASKRVRASLDTVYLDFGRFHSEVRIARHFWLSGGYAFTYMPAVTVTGSAFDPNHAVTCAMANGSLTDEGCQARLQGRARPSANGRYTSVTHDLGMTLTVRF